MKIIIATLCTLALSVLGTFGINQNSLDLNNELNTNSEIEKTEEYTTDVEIPVTDDITTDTVDTQKDAIQKEEIPQVSNNEETAVIANEVNNTQADKTETPDTNKNNDTANAVTVSAQEEADNNNSQTDNSYNKPSNNTAVQSEPAAPKVTTVPVKETANNNATQAVNTNATKQTPATNTTKQVTANNNADCDLTNSQKAIVYSNADLSKNGSVNDIINELQKNGYSNINGKNVKNINDIISQINDNCPTDSSKYTPSKPAQNNNNSKPQGSANPTDNTGNTSNSGNNNTNTNNNSGISSYANQVLQLVNQERAKAGLPAFTTNSSLTAAANKRAQETVQSFSHTRPNGSSFSTVLTEYNVSFRAAGENIAYGQRTPQEVVTGWMNSPGHRANILNSSFGKIGIGVYQSSNGTIYWTQEFTN